MKALIIAAGRGSGFRGLAPRSHKALTPILGLAVIERTLAACPQINELVIVTGFRAELLEADLRKLIGCRVGLSFVHNPEWERANGVSVYAARQALGSEAAFLLLMSDHLFEPALLERLIEKPPRPGECLLAVDRNFTGVFELEDATKVRLGTDQRIEKIGKGLEDYNAVDTGAFYCTPAIFEALARAIAGGKESLSDGVRVLCERGDMGFRDVTGCLWQDVDNPESLALAKKRLWQAVQKPRDGVVSRLLNRRVSGFITQRICSLPVRPNHVTFFNLGLSVLAAGLIASGHLITGGLTAQLYSILDGVDGELARLKHQGSWFGAWLDNLTDRLCDWAIICGAAWSVTHTGWDTRSAWLLMCLALVSNIFYRSGMDCLLVTGALRNTAGTPGWLARVEKWFYDREMVFGITHDSYLFLLAAGVACGAPFAAVSLLAGLESLWWILKIQQARHAQPSERYVDFLTRKEPVPQAGPGARPEPELAARQTA